MQRRLLLHTGGALGAGLALTGAAGLTGCAGFGGPTVITLTEAELQRLLAREFPLNRRLLEVLQVELPAPTLALQPERNRLGLAFTAQVQDRLTQRPLRGELGFDTALRFEPRDASVRLTQVRVNRLRRLADARPTAGGAAGVSAPTAADPRPGFAAVSPAEGLLSSLGAAVAERMLEDLPIYTLSAERRADLRRLGLAPGAVTVTARGVEITLARQP